MVSLLRMVSRTKSCSQLAWRKRTSVLAGWTLTSTSSGGISRNSSTTGKEVGGKNIAVGLAHRVHEQAVAHQAAIDEAVDGVAVEFLQLRLGGEAADAQPSRLRRLVVRGPLPGRGFGQPGACQLDLGRQGKQLIQGVLAEDLKDALRRLAHRGRDQQGMGGGVQLEVLVRDGPARNV